MDNLLNSTSDGLRIDKSLAENVITILKGKDLINYHFKIAHIDNNVIIPIHNTPNISQLLHNFNFKIISFNFSVKNKPPQSILQYLKTIIPIDFHIDIPTSFEMIGDIVVIDLKESMIQYAKIIGEAILTVQNSVKSVYRKSSKVDGLLRLRGLEQISGESNTKTIHTEYGLKIKVDISKVYFSPRLATEHRRIALLVKRDEHVLDMFGGVAPFALHIAQLINCEITTLDINPDVTKLIKESILLNKQIIGNIHILEGDAEKVGLTLIHEKRKFDRIIMNHPSKSHKYLTIAIKLLQFNGVIHLYIFAPIKNYEKYCIDLIKSISNKIRIHNTHIVRQSSPSDYHICITLSINNNA